jgi:nitrogen PTS system EIIA component
LLRRLLPLSGIERIETKRGGQRPVEEMDATKGFTFADLLTVDRIRACLRARHKREVMRILAAHISKTTGLDSRLTTDAVLSSADFPVFGPGTGVALPHAVLPGLEKPVAAFARLDPALDFGASDGSLTDLVVLLLSPEDDLAAHLRALACIARRMRNNEVRQHLRAATGPDSVTPCLQMTSEAAASCRGVTRDLDICRKQHSLMTMIRFATFQLALCHAGRLIAGIWPRVRARLT